MTVIVNGTTGITYPDNTTQATAGGSGGGGLTWQAVVTANTTVSKSNAYAVSTVAQPIYITLPSSPGAGNSVQLSDYAGTWSSNNVVIVGNGSNIQGATANIVLSTNRQSVAFVYIDAAQGWIPYAQGSGAGTYSVDYLIVAGGGGAAGDIAGGGGGGGVITNSALSVSPGTAYTITVGAGGTGGTTNTRPSSGQTNGSNSSAFTYTAVGGGTSTGYKTSGNANGTSGGSGGGGSPYDAPVTSGAGGSGTG